MMDVGDMPNIGDVLAGRLRAAWIADAAQLQKLGDAAAFGRVRAGS